MSVLWRIRSFLVKPLTIRNFPSLDNYNTIVVRNILEVISPNWDKCLKNATLFKILFNVYLIFISLGLFRPLLTNIFRYSIGLFLTSLVIAWNEALYSYSILRNLSDYMYYNFVLLFF